MANIINRAIFEIAKRSEKKNREYLVSSFANVGPLIPMLETLDNQVLYGRRGTGKTHIFTYILDNIEKQNNVGVYIDMRNIGSNGGIYADIRIPIAERASRLLIDTFTAIHDQLIDYVLTHDQDDIDLSKVGPILDELADAISHISVEGDVSLIYKDTDTHIDGYNLKGIISTDSVGIGGNFSETNGLTKYSEKQVRGTERHRIHFPTFSDLLRRLLRNISNRTIWIFFDEWAEIPNDLQPYLADLIRRTLFPVTGVIVKIAAIERRVNFKIDVDGDVSYIGIEGGTELSSLDLDEFMVFDNDSEKAKQFFLDLLYNHIKQILLEKGENNIPDKKEFINKTFTQINAFEELVRAAEGVPRDAINIISFAAMKTYDSKISVQNVRDAARQWYCKDKESVINSKIGAAKLLRWIIDEVIGSRKARAFLLSCDINDPLIEYLYDARILHVVKSNISAKDKPGERYNVYAIDYGAYVHLINTANAVAENSTDFIDVPMIDYRSVRRAILDIEKFYDDSTSKDMAQS